MLNKFIKFPLYLDDGKPAVELNDLQKSSIAQFNQKIATGKYRYTENPCPCGNRDKEYDIVLTEKDRYGFSLRNALCKKCGLVRSEKKLDEKSIESFYRYDYRNIYLGEDIPSKEYFDDQEKRGQAFLNLVKEAGLLDKIKSVFEFGCGAGGVLFPFHTKGMDVSGCDFDEKYLNFGISQGLKLYQGDINANYTPEASNDLIILSHVMEHFTNNISSLNMIIKAIKPKRYMLIEVPGIFRIDEVYINPILYFQNAHIFNYYRFYLQIFFETLGLKIIYGDEKCYFILQKPENWHPISEKTLIYHPEMNQWAKKIEDYFLKTYFLHKYKLNKYIYILKIRKIFNC